MAEEYPLPDPKWVERMRELKSGREVGEPIFPGVTGMIDLGKQIYGETKGGLEAFHNILFGKEEPGDVYKLTPMLMNLTGFGAGSGLAINKDKAIRQLARLASQERKKILDAHKAIGYGEKPEIMQGLRGEFNYREFFQQLKDIPQSEWDKVERVSGLPGRHKSKGQVVPYERGPELKFRMGTPLEITEGTVPHEFAHVRQFVPEGAQKARFDFMVALREQIYEEGVLHRGLSKADVYSQWDPLEMHARNVATRVQNGEEFGKAVANALKDMDDYLAQLKSYFPEQYKRAHELTMKKTLGSTPAPASAFPERPPIRGAKTGMKLRPEGKEAMEKARRGEKLWMEETEGERLERMADEVAGGRFHADFDEPRSLRIAEDRAIAHGIDSPENLESILTKGLRPGSSVGGQASEYPIKLIFDEPGRLKSVTHRPGDFTTTRPIKPNAIEVDVSQYVEVRPYSKIADDLEKAIERVPESKWQTDPAIKKLNREMDYAMELFEYEKAMGRAKGEYFDWKGFSGEDVVKEVQGIAKKHNIRLRVKGRERVKKPTRPEGLTDAYWEWLKKNAPERIS